MRIDFEKVYRLPYGTVYPDVFYLELPQIEGIKRFIECAFHEWVFFSKKILIYNCGKK